jgi:hypothetical protein
VGERAAFLAAASVDALADVAAESPATAGPGAPRDTQAPAAPRHASLSGAPCDAGDLRLRVGDAGGFLALAYPSREPRDAAELAALALEERIAGVDRLRAPAPWCCLGT